MYVKNLFDLSKKIIAISGASGYLGNIITKNIAAMGASIAIFDLPQTKEALSTLEEDICTEFNVKAKSYTVDITNEDEVNQLSLNIINDFHKIDGLVNIAGINRHGTLFDHTFDDFSKVLSVNVAGTFICCKSFAKYMCQSKSGSIVNFSSMNGTVSSLPPKSMVAYDSSKAAILHMSRTLAGELGVDNVRCNTVSPGIMEKGMSNVKGFKPADDAYVKKTLDMTPMKRHVKPEELAGAVIYLLSDASSATTGIDIKVDAGYGVW